MSAPDKTGGPAFPFPASAETDPNSPMGMTLRDWYLGQILAGMWASRTYEPFKSFPSDEEHACMVKHAMKSADLAIAAREAKP